MFAFHLYAQTINSRVVEKKNLSAHYSGELFVTTNAITAIRIMRNKNNTDGCVMSQHKHWKMNN